MKLHKISMVLANLVLALMASAVTPTPNPSPSARPSPADNKPIPTDTRSPAPKISSPSPTASEQLPSPMEKPLVASTPANLGPPKPVLYLMGMEAYTAGGKNWIRLHYDVLNKADYPADMFAAAPSLPPCGLNTNASRTWVDFFDATGKRIYGFCALSKPADLGKIWFAYEEGTIPPSYVYIELNDRQTNTKYKSNLADTTI